MITTHITIPKERTLFYAVIYLFVLLLVAIFAGRALTKFFAWGIPIELFIWIDKELSMLIGIFIAVMTAILIWPLIDRRVDFNTQKVYYNPYYKPEVGLTYLTGFNIGNILEELASPISAVIKTWTTPTSEPLSATCTDDVLRVYGTLIVQETDPNILTLAENSAARLDVALTIARSKVESLIEQFTHDRPSSQILGRSEEVTAFVMERINSLPDLQNRGFAVSWTTANMDESLAVKAAREEMKSGILFGQVVRSLATPYEELLNPDGSVRQGVITTEEAAAIELARRKSGSFTRNVDEKIIRLVGDPEILEKLRGQGLLVGTVGGEVENSNNL
jgi:hypothetical protein